MTMFRYTLLVGDAEWVSTARLIITDTSGGSKLEYKITQGRPAGKYRIFLIPVRSGVLYDGELRIDDFTLKVFTGANLAAFVSEDDQLELAELKVSYNILPPDPNEGGYWS